MTIKKILAVAAIAAGAFPAGAYALGKVAPPGGDDYTAPVSLSDFKDPQPLPADFDFDADTSKYTLQDDMYKPPKSGGPREPRRCGPSTYSKTIWTVFHADRKGVMTIRATADSFDPVIGFIPFGNPTTDIAPHLDEGVCIDASAEHEEQISVQVQAGHWYAVQVGGTGKPAGGHVAFHYHFAPDAPQAAPKTLRMTLRARATASSGGAKFTKVIVARQKKNGKLVGPSPRGATVAVRCVRGCRGRTLKLTGNAIRLRFLENKVLPPGTKFVVRVTRRNPLARGPQWTVTVDRHRKVHVSRPRLVGG